METQNNPVWMAVDKKKNEYIFLSKPHRDGSKWVCDSQQVNVKRGTIEKFSKQRITWENEPLESTSIIMYKYINPHPLMKKEFIWDYAILLPDWKEIRTIIRKKHEKMTHIIIKPEDQEVYTWDSLEWYWEGDKELCIITVVTHKDLKNEGDVNLYYIRKAN